MLFMEMRYEVRTTCDYSKVAFDLRRWMTYKDLTLVGIITAAIPVKIFQINSMFSNTAAYWQTNMNTVQIGNFTTYHDFYLPIGSDVAQMVKLFTAFNSKLLPNPIIG